MKETVFYQEIYLRTGILQNLLNKVPKYDRVVTSLGNSNENKDRTEGKRRLGKKNTLTI